MSSSELGRSVVKRGAKDAKETNIVPEERAAHHVRTVQFRDVNGSTEAAEQALRAQAEFAERLSCAQDVAYERGRAEAAGMVAEEHARLAERIDGALAYVHRALTNAETAVAADSVRLALLIAEKIVRKAMRLDPEALENALRSAVEATEGNQSLTVMCDPASAGTLRAQIAELTRALEVSGLEIEEDARLIPGDLMLHRGTTTLDARLETRLRRIEQTLVRELGIEVADAKE